MFYACMILYNSFSGHWLLRGGQLVITKQQPDQPLVTPRNLAPKEEAKSSITAVLQAATVQRIVRGTTAYL